MSRISVLLLLVTVGACNSISGNSISGPEATKIYDAALDNYIGIKEALFIEVRGTPDRVYKTSDGTQYLTYIESLTEHVPGSAPSYTTTIVGNTAYTTGRGGSSGYTYQTKCETTFGLKNGRVVNWKYQGAACIDFAMGYANYVTNKKRNKQ